MDRLNIGETILKLRKERNITQEQLANMVGVSAGAVSKWETGNSMPDISLLSPIARALNTSLDILLSFRQELSEEEAAEIKQKLIYIFLHQGYSSGEAECRKYLKEYPNSICLKLAVAGLIQMYSMMSDKCTEEFANNRLNEALAMFQEVSESREPKYAPAALFCMAGIQMMLKNYEESEKTLKKLPSMQINPMDLYPALLLNQGKTKEALPLCSRILLQNINNASGNLITLSRISKSEGDYNKAIFYLEAANKIQNEYNIGMGSAAYSYAVLYKETGDKKNAAKWFKTYAERVISAPYDYSDNPYFNNVVLEVKSDGQKIIRKKLLQSLIEEDDFKSLAGISDYEDAVKELKDAVREM